MGDIKFSPKRTKTMRAKSNKATRQAAKTRKAEKAEARAAATRRINKANKKESIKTTHKGKQPDTHVRVIGSNIVIKSAPKVRAITIIK